MDKPQFVYAIYIATTPQKLWAALLDGEFARDYWAGRTLHSSWKPGEPIEARCEDGTLDWWGQVLEVQPPNRLSYTFTVDMKHPEFAKDPKGPPTADEPPSRVTFEIEQFQEQVKLKVTHDQFAPGSRILKGVSEGWPTILSGLKTLLEGGKTLFPNWR